MAGKLVGRLDIEHGTTAVVRHRLSRPARLLTTEGISHGIAARAADPLPELMLVLDQPSAPSSRCAVHGVLDTTNAERFADELNRLTLGGSHETVVDLTAVTHLASAAVAVLLRINTSGNGSEPPLRLYAPAGSVAHHALAVGGLPFTTTDPDQRR
ncbi:MAG: STAS domain-containing protein [Kutzneria sp.]|nr:STAS domain-containing protein [Kutzneria sp.]